jgi:hypothetical protein
VVFVIPGEVKDPGFSGVRTGRYDSKTRHLLVQAAVPQDAPTERAAILLELLRKAIHEAEAFAKKRGLIADRLESIREIVDAL